MQGDHIIKPIIRAWTLADAQRLTHFTNNKNVLHYFLDGFPFPYTHEHAVSFITLAMKEMSKEKRNGMFAIDIDGDAVGHIGYHRQTDVYRYNAELGYWLGEEYWGQGIMTHAIRLMIEYVFTKTELLRLEARTFVPNQGSQRVLEKNGFVREAHHIGNVMKDGSIMDSYMYALRREQWMPVR